MPVKRQKAEHGSNGLSVDRPEEENTEENEENADDGEEDNSGRFAYSAAAPETTKFYGNAETYSHTRTFRGLIQDTGNHSPRH